MDINTISSSLHIHDDGIWYSTDNQAISYPCDGNESYFMVEDTSFWFRHRNECIVSVVKSFPPPDNAPIFDIGGGNGFVSLGLAQGGFNVVLVEPGRAGAANAKKRGIKDVICATTETANFQPHSLPAIGLFDVIEHIDDHISFLRSARELLNHGGYLYATVPAFSFLWSQEDVLAGHHRRYTLNSISDTLKTSGFEVLFSSYIFRFLPAPIFLLRSLPHLIGLSKKTQTLSNVNQDHTAPNGPLARIFNAMLKPEIEKLRSKKAMRFGGSCLIVAKCP